MMTLAGKRLFRYEVLMQKTADQAFEISEDFLCKGCPHHRPDWEYRFCEFLECPYVKGQKTFWEEVAKMSGLTDYGGDHNAGISC